MERPLNCLIIDDNKVARVLLQQILTKLMVSPLLQSLMMH